MGLCRRTVVCSLAGLLALGAVGCGVALTAAAGLGVGLLDDDGARNSAPAASITTPSGVQTDVVAVEYRLTDVEGDRASVAVEYSLDGVAFSPATQAVLDEAEGTVNLTASLQGEAHTFSWNASADLGFVDVQGVQVRLTPRDAAAATRVGEPAVSGTFDVFNTFITTLARRPPSAGVAASSLAVDSDGDLIVADLLGHRVLRLEVATGEAEVLAGTGEIGFNGDGILGSEAHLNSPFAVMTVPGTGGADDVLVVDAGNARVRRVDGRTRFLTAVAGGGTSSGEEAAAQQAKLLPGDGAVDAGGNLFLIDSGRRVRAINLASSPSLVLPTGTAPGCPSLTGSHPIGLERIGTVVAREPDCDGESAFVVDALQGPAAAAIYDDGAGVRSLYLLENTVAAATGGAAGSRGAQVSLVNFGSGPVDVETLSGGAVEVQPGDIAVVASAVDLVGVDLELLPDLAVVERDVLVVTSAEGSGVYALNLSASTATVAGTAVAAGSVQRVVGTGTAGFAGDGKSPLEVQLSLPSAIAATPEGHLVIGELVGRVRVVASPTASFTFGGLTIPAGTVDTLPIHLPGLEPRLLRPLGLTATPGGDVLVTDIEQLDPRSNRLYRVRADTGAHEPLLGSGLFGDDGDGGLALDASVGALGKPGISADGQLVVAPDFAFHRLRAVNLGGQLRDFLGVTIAPGQVETVAGMGEPAQDPTDPGAVGDGGPATAARLTSPFSVAFDAAGLLWVSDSGAHRLRVCNPTEQAATVLGVSIAPGAIETVLGRSGAPGTPTDDTAVAAASALLEVPVAFFGGDGRLYVADGLGEPARPRVRVVNLGGQAFTVGGVTVAAGTVERVIGSGDPRDPDDADRGDGGPALAATFRSITGVSVRADGLAFVSDERDQRLRVVNLSSQPLVVGGRSLAAGSIDTLVGTGSPGFDPDPSSVAAGFFGSTGSGRLDGPFTSHPFADGRLLLADSANGALRLINLAGAPRSFGGAHADPGDMVVVAGSRSGRVQASSPVGLRVDGGGRVLFADLGPFGDDPRLLELDPQSRVINRVAGTGDKTAADDSNLGDGGPALLATFETPADLALDGEGSVYLADAGSGRVRFVNRTSSDRTPLAAVTVPPGGVHTVVVGGNGDGNPANDEGLPCGPGAAGETIDALTPLAVARAADVLWIADAEGERVLRVDAGAGALDAQFLGGHVLPALPTDPSLTSDPLSALAPRLIPQAGVDFPALGVRAGDVVVVESATLPFTVGGVTARPPVTVEVDLSANGFLRVAEPIAKDDLLAPGDLRLSYRVIRPSRPTAVAAISDDQALVAYRPALLGTLIVRLAWDPVSRAWEVPEPIAGTLLTGWNGDRQSALSMNIDSVAGMAVDGDLLLVADDELHRVVAVHLGALGDPAFTVAGLDLQPGEARTVAGGGAGKPGFNGDALPPHLALLNEPAGVAVGTTGGVYIADLGNGRVRRFQR